MVQKRLQTSSLAQRLRHAIGSQSEGECLGFGVMQEILRPLVGREQGNGQALAQLSEKTISNSRAKGMVKQHDFSRQQGIERF